MGYESILSEDGDAYYDTNIHTHDACLAEVATSQMFVLIIGGRFGGKYKSDEISITNKEYREALNQKIPIFTIVDNSVYSEHHVYTENRQNKDIDVTKISYPSVDNTKIFDFIDEVRKNIVNNAIFPFKNYSDIEQYSRKQWAGMMHQFLTAQSESKRVGELFEKLQVAIDKIELYTRQTVDVVGDDSTKKIIQLHDTIIQSPSISDLKTWGFILTPTLILNNPTLEDLCGNKIVIKENNGDSITHGGPPYMLSRRRYIALSKDYFDLHTALKSLINEMNISMDELSNISISLYDLYSVRSVFN